MDVNVASSRPKKPVSSALWLCGLMLSAPVWAMEDSAWSLNPHTLSRLPPSELNFGLTPARSGFQYGVKLRNEAPEDQIPDLGTRGLSQGLDGDALAQDMVASRNPNINLPRKNALRMNWLSYQSEDYRLEVSQSPSRAGLRFLHVASGVRVEAERRVLGGAFTVFMGVRLYEDRRYEPTLGCSLNNHQQPDSRTFCGFRLRVSL